PPRLAAGSGRTVISCADTVPGAGSREAMKAAPAPPVRFRNVRRSRLIVVLLPKRECGDHSRSPRRAPLRGAATAAVRLTTRDAPIKLPNPLEVSAWPAT